MSKRRQGTQISQNQLSLFPELEVPIQEPLEGYKPIPGDTLSEKLDEINTRTYTATKDVSLEDYCKVICEWLRINKGAYSILDFYEDEKNKPFLYPISETGSDINVNKLLEYRISRDASKGILRGTITNDLMKNLYGWADKKELDVQSGADIKFEFDS